MTNMRHTPATERQEPLNQCQQRPSGAANFTGESTAAQLPQATTGT